jgi:hypothetical protein
MSNEKQELTDTQLDQMLSQLKDTPPELDADLWPGIKNKLPQTQTWWPQAAGLSIAASLFVCILSLGYSVYLHQDNNNLRTQLTASIIHDATPAGISAIPVSLNSQSCSESQDEVIIRENLIIIEMALTQIRTALKESPNNPTLNKRLLDLSKQQINLVNRANTIAL